MITELTITGFKRFLHADIALAPLTILAGMNGAGKTSTIQALLLLRQSSADLDVAVELNGGMFDLSLGTYDGIRNWDAVEPISITLKDDSEASHTWRFDAAADDLFVTSEYFGEAPPRALSSRGRNFQFLSAERMGPRTTQSLSSVPIRELSTGCRGEHSAQVHYELGDQILETGRRSPNAGDKDPPLLKVEAEKWLSYILMPIQLDSELTKNSGVASIKFRTAGNDWVAAPNMGFGVTYCLPIVLAALTSELGGMLVVENPEAHLHPAAQSRMGIFLAKMASSGVQVVMETHSDHVLNGVRRAIGDKTLASRDAIVQYFDHESSSPNTELHFNETGGMSNWPTGFFDQYQIDVAAISRVRRSR